MRSFGWVPRCVVADWFGASVRCFDLFGRAFDNPTATDESVPAAERFIKSPDRKTTNRAASFAADV